MSSARQLLLPLVRRHPVSDLPWHGSGRRAGVLVALTEEREPRVVLGRRARHLPLHPGEVAFPGGKLEPGDRGPWDTALREAEEEVALPQTGVSRQAQLPPMVTRSGYQVHACVGLIPPDAELVFDPNEFDSLLLPRLVRFADPGLFRLERMSDGERQLLVPHYRIGADNVWGVTARILVEIVNLVYDARFTTQADRKDMP